MNIGQRIRAAYRAFQATAALSSSYESGIDGKPGTATVDSLYKDSSSVYSCIKLRADSFGRPVLRVYRRTGTGREEAPDSPLQALLNKANPFWTRTQLWRAMQTDLGWHGNAFWALEFAGRRQPQEAWRLRPDWMEIKTDSTNYIDHYEYEVGNNKIEYSPAEIIHFRYANPLNEWWGLTPLAAALLPADTGIEAMTRTRTLFKNLAVPSTVLQTQEALDKDRADEIKAEWTQALAGSKQAGRTVVLHSGLKVETLGMTQEQAQTLETQRWTVEDVARVFRVPLPLIGQVAAVYRSIREAEAALWHEALIPELLWAEEILNEELVPFFGDDLFVAFDLTGIEALQEDAEKKFQRYQGMLDRGVYTVNEVRLMERIGPPVGWGDAWWAPLNLSPVKRGRPETSAMSTPVSAPVRAWQLDPDEVDYLGARIGKWLEAEAGAIAEAYTIHSAAFRAGTYQYDWGRWEGLEPIISGGIEPPYQAAAETQVLQLAAEPSLALPNIRAAEWAERYAGLTVTRISNHTIGQINDVLAKAVKEGWARDRLANELRGHAAFSPTRARTIARTETQKAFNVGNLRGYELSGVVEGKTWLVVGADPCELCVANGAQEPVSIDQGFASGHDTPPAHSNCLCRVLPKLNDSEGER